MTTSCCPAYVQAVKKHIPELQKFVSHTRSPMHYTAATAKEEDANAVTVFIGPCIAKRIEAEEDENVDHVLTFEELGALFVAAEIDVAACEPIPFAKPASKFGRIFAISGGVASAVTDLSQGKVLVVPEPINGLSRDAVKLLKRFACKGCTGNLLEVMACEGGCVAGPGVVATPKAAARAVEKLAAESGTLS